MDWISHALSIWACGYEGWREALEFKPVDPSLHGAQMNYQSVEVTKGFGRITILWFTVLYTYQKLYKSFTEEELEQFKEWLESKY